ncbi:hypothetical protein JTE90_024526 [Oedothorax gibbosus]|uniref:DUF4773 domain-containing protein n=1 Tax=Oedothorax gibbosus TaxID=931172 RepID=A0AAV6TPX0_9ARAC|nr:hypothetical protein JTE90_024526 [Oedothorax gibbosus]
MLVMKYLVFTIVILVFKTATAAEINPGSAVGLDGEPFNCECEGLSCKCCVMISVTDEMMTKACITFTYHGERTELQTTITINEEVVFDEPIISANHPPPICVSYPGLNVAADLCFDFYDIQVFPDSIHVCLRVTPRVLFQPVTQIEIGCYTLQ